MKKNLIQLHVKFKVILFVIFHVANPILACFSPRKLPAYRFVFFCRFSLLNGLCFVDFDKWASPRNATTIHLRSLFPIAMAIKHLLNFVFLKRKKKAPRKEQFHLSRVCGWKALKVFNFLQRESLLRKICPFEKFFLLGTNNLMIFCFISLLWAMNLAGFGRAPGVRMMYVHHQKNG